MFQVSLWRYFGIIEKSLIQQSEPKFENLPLTAGLLPTIDQFNSPL
jgi:hypothetical protein